MERRLIIRGASRSSRAANGLRGEPLRYSWKEERYLALRAFALVLAVTVILAGARGLSKASTSPSRRDASYLVKITDRKIDFPSAKPPPAPDPIKPEVIPEQPAPKPPPKAVRKRKPRRSAKEAAIKSRPRTHKSADEPSDNPPKEVFGVDANSVVKGGGQSTPVGNTLMKEPEREFTPPWKVKSVYNPPEVDKAPRYKKVIKPSYPRPARIQGVEGVVKISLVVDENGNPTRIRVTKGIGHGCDEAALRAVGNYRFYPGIIDGRPVKVRVVVPVRFSLND